MASKKLTELQKSPNPSGKRIPIEGSGQVMEYTTPEDILDTPHVLPPDSIPALTEDKIPQLPASKIDGIDTAIQGWINEVNAGLVTQVNNLDNNKGALWNKDKVTAPTDFDATDGGGKFLSMDNKWETPSVPVLSDIAIAGEDLGQAGELTPVFFGTGGETITDGQSATVGKTSTETTFTLPTSSISPYVREILITKTETGNPDDVYLGNPANTNPRRLLPTDFTTYTKDGWTLGANSEYSNTPARKARNGDTSDSWGSFWSTDFNNLTVSESTPAIFTIQAPNKKIFEKVKVRWRKNNSTDNRAVDTEIFGVNNGVRTSLGARTGQNEPASAVEREYILSNNSEGFTSLEIKITRASSSDQIIINDIDIYGFDYGKQVSIPNGQSVLKIDNTVTDLTFTTAGASPSNYSTITIDEVRYGFDTQKIYVGKNAYRSISYEDNTRVKTKGSENYRKHTLKEYVVSTSDGYDSLFSARIYASFSRYQIYGSGRFSIELNGEEIGAISAPKYNNVTDSTPRHIESVQDIKNGDIITIYGDNYNDRSDVYVQSNDFSVRGDYINDIIRHKYDGVIHGSLQAGEEAAIIRKGYIKTDTYPSGELYINSMGEIGKDPSPLYVGYSKSNILAVGISNATLTTDTTQTATTGSVSLGNAEGYITVIINGEQKKIPYYGV